MILGKKGGKIEALERSASIIVAVMISNRRRGSVIPHRLLIRKGVLGKTRGTFAKCSSSTRCTSGFRSSSEARRSSEVWRAVDAR